MSSLSVGGISKTISMGSDRLDTGSAEIKGIIELPYPAVYSAISHKIYRYDEAN